MKITLFHHLLFVNHLLTNRQLFMSMVNYQKVSFLKIAGLRSLLSPEMGHPQTNSGCKIETYVPTFRWIAGYKLTISHNCSRPIRGKVECDEVVRMNVTLQETNI